MNTKLTRRTALAGTVALPLAPAAYVQAADITGIEPANATDAAWAQYQAGNAAYREWKAAEHSFLAFRGFPGRFLRPR